MISFFFFLMVSLSFKLVQAKIPVSLLQDLFWLFPLSIVHNPDCVCWILMHGRTEQCVCGPVLLFPYLRYLVNDVMIRESMNFPESSSRTMHTFYSIEVVIESTESNSLSPQAIIFNPVGIQSMDLISWTPMIPVFEALFLC